MCSTLPEKSKIIVRVSRSRRDYVESTSFTCVPQLCPAPGEVASRKQNKKEWQIRTRFYAWSYRFISPFFSAWFMFSWLLLYRVSNKICKWNDVATALNRRPRVSQPSIQRTTAENCVYRGFPSDLAFQMIFPSLSRKRETRRRAIKLGPARNLSRAD